VKKRHDSWTLVKALLVHPPCLQCGAGNLKHLGGLPLRDALSFEIVILLQQLSALDAIPTLVAIIVASLRLLDYRAHRYLLLPFFAFVFVMAKDGEVAFLFQRAGKRLRSIQVPAFQCCEQELSFFFERALRMILRRWRAST
jgi:hypothetical protein